MFKPKRRKGPLTLVERCKPAPYEVMFVEELSQTQTQASQAAPSGHPEA